MSVIDISDCKAMLFDEGYNFFATIIVSEFRIKLVIDNEHALAQ